MKFKDFLNESKYERAVFEYDGSEDDAQTLIDDELWDWVENQEYVTIEDVLVFEGDDDASSMIHFIGHDRIDSKHWKNLAKEVQRKFKGLSLERFI